MKNQLQRSYLFFVILASIFVTVQGCKKHDKSTSENAGIETSSYDWIVTPGKEQVVAMINRDAYKKLKSEIEQYKDDVEANFPVQFNIVQGDWVRPEEVRNYIRELYQAKSISGVVLIGAMPMNKFYMHDFANPNPLYYEAFDLQFIDANKDGISDSYLGKPILKIWVANLRGIENPNDQGIEILRVFFNKTHVYYNGGMNIENRALAVTGSDWPDGANAFANKIKPIFGSDNIDVLSSKAITHSAILDAFKNHTYTIFYIQVHSTESRQDLEPGVIYADEIAELETGSLFIVNHGCSTGNWLKAYKTGQKNICMSWIFGKSAGQAIIANVRTGMVYGQDSIYSRILKGDYLGKAYFSGKKAAEQEMYNDYPNGDIVSGVTFIGNPFIYINPKK